MQKKLQHIFSGFLFLRLYPKNQQYRSHATTPVSQEVPWHHSETQVFFQKAISSQNKPFSSLLICQRRDGVQREGGRKSWDRLRCIFLITFFFQSLWFAEDSSFSIEDSSFGTQHCSMESFTISSLEGHIFLRAWDFHQLPLLFRLRPPKC